MKKLFVKIEGRRVSVKTLDITGKEWFDRLNGNSYHSARVTVNFGTPSEKTLFVPFQYGYGDSYKHSSLEVLKSEYKAFKGIEYLHKLREFGIIIRTNKIENCKKSEVVNWGGGK